MALKLTTYRRGSNLPELPGESLFHSNRLFNIYAKTPGFTPLLITATDGNSLLAKILVGIRTVRILFPPFFFKRGYVFNNGEYFVEENQREDIFGAMLEHLTKEAFRESFMMEFRNLDNSLFGYKYFRENDYFPINWSRVRNSLHSQRKVEERMSTSRIRQVRKGLSNGATIHEVKTREEIDEFARTLHKIDSTFLREHFPNTAFFENIFDSLSQNKEAKMFTVRYKGKIIGSSLCFYSGSNAYLRFSGGKKKRYAKQYPGVLAVWAALSDAFERGFKHFEFMDVGLSFKYHGYRDFALRFGGKQSGARRWFCFRWRWLNKLCIKLYV